MTTTDQTLPLDGRAAAPEPDPGDPLRHDLMTTAAELLTAAQRPGLHRIAVESLRQAASLVMRASLAGPHRSAEELTRE